MASVERVGFRIALIVLNQPDGSGQVLAALFHTAPLPAGAGYLRRPGDKQFAIALNDRCEFVPHGTSIERKS
jgi:hypothetical protein